MTKKRVIRKNKLSRIKKEAGCQNQPFFILNNTVDVESKFKPTKKARIISLAFLK